MRSRQARQALTLLEVSVRQVTLSLLALFVASVAFANAVDDGNQLSKRNVGLTPIVYSCPRHNQETHLRNTTWRCC